MKFAQDECAYIKIEKKKKHHNNTYKNKLLNDQTYSRRLKLSISRPR